jgi:hypothetical protein
MDFCRAFLVQICDFYDITKWILTLILSSNLNGFWEFLVHICDVNDHPNRIYKGSRGRELFAHLLMLTVRMRIRIQPKANAIVA